MARKDIGTSWDRETRNNMQDNFIELYDEYIGAGMDAKEALDKVNQMLGTAEDALSVARLSNAKSDETQQQLDDIIIDSGTSDAEVVQARGGEPLLKDRLNKTDEQLAETDDQSFLNRPVSRFAERKPMITIHDDDGNRGFYIKMFEVAKEYNIPITSAIITNRAMGFPDDERPYDNRYYHYTEVMEMKGSGLVEFVSHTNNHLLNMNDEPRELLHEEFVGSRKFMKKWGFNHRVVVIPGGHINEKVIEEARQVYEYMTTYGGADIVATPPFSNYKIPRVNFDKGVEQIKGFIDEAHANNSWVILRTHVDQSQNLTNPEHRYSNDKFREIIEYAQSLDFEFVTTEEGIKNHANIMELNENNTINANGKIYSDSLGRVTLSTKDVEGNNINNDTPLTKFKTKTITHSYITNPNINGFPSSKGSGILTTYRLSDVNDTYNYQTFRPTGQNELYMRNWVSTEGVWGSWESTSGITYLGVNAVDVSTRPIHSSLYSRISMSKIDTNHLELSSFPEERTGYLTTNAFTADGFAYQLYSISGSKTEYKRDWNSTDNQWGEWYLKNDRFYNTSNIINKNMKPRDFPRGVTISRYDSNIPFINGVSSGMVRTTVFEQGNSTMWVKQEVLSNSQSGSGAQMFIRTGLSGNEWSSWNKVLTEPV